MVSHAAEGRQVTDLYRHGTGDGEPVNENIIEKLQTADELIFEGIQFLDESPDIKILEWGMDFLKDGPTLTIGEDNGEK